MRNNIPRFCGSLDAGQASRVCRSSSASRTTEILDEPCMLCGGACSAKTMQACGDGSLLGVRSIATGRLYTQYDLWLVYGPVFIARASIWGSRFKLVKTSCLTEQPGWSSDESRKRSGLSAASSNRCWRAQRRRKTSCPSLIQRRIS